MVNPSSIFFPFLLILVNIIFNLEQLRKKISEHLIDKVNHYINFLPQEGTIPQERLQKYREAEIVNPKDNGKCVTLLDAANVFGRTMKIYSKTLSQIPFGPSLARVYWYTVVHGFIETR